MSKTIAFAELYIYLIEDIPMLMDCQSQKPGTQRTEGDENVCILQYEGNMVTKRTLKKLRAEDGRIPSRFDNQMMLDEVDYYDY